MARIEEVGVPIDLADPPVLNQRLVALVETEGALYSRGVTCGVKDRPDTTCCACPIRAEEGPLAPLCNLGREQERVLTLLAIHDRRDTER